MARSIRLPSAWARLREVLTVLFSHYLRHPGQFVFMATGLVTGVALWAAVQLINDQARASYAEADQMFGAQVRYWVRPRGSADGVSVEDYVRLRRLGFRAVYPVVEGRVAISDGNFMRLVATDLLALPGGVARGIGPAARNADNAQAGGTGWSAFSQPPWQAWYPASLASRLGVSDGEQVLLANKRKLPPARIQAQAGQGERVFMDVGAAFAVLSRNSFSYLSVGAGSGDDATRLGAALPGHLELVPNQQATDLTELTASLHTNLAALGLLSFAVGLFIVFNAVRFALLSRQATMNTLRELGVSPRMLSTAIVIEALAFSVVGTLAGVAFGYALALVLLPTVAGSLQGLYGALVDPNIQLKGLQVLQAWLLTLAGMLLALAMPMWQAARQSVQASRAVSDHWLRDARGRVQLFGAGLVLAVAAVITLPRISSVTGGFAVLALVLFAGALCLPFLLQCAIRLLSAAIPPTRWQWRWGVGDALAQLPFLRVALMALLLTLSANIGVSTLVGSFRDALSDWLGTRLSADIYVQSSGLDIPKLLGPDSSSWLQNKHERVEARLRFGTRPATVAGFDPSAPDVHAGILTAGVPGAWQTWLMGERQAVDGGETGGGEGSAPVPIIANEQVRYLGGVEPGDIVVLETAGGPSSFRVVGYVHDYGASSYRFYLPIIAFREAWPAAPSLGLAFWIKPGKDVEAFAALEAAGAEPGEWIEQRRLKEISFAVFDRTFLITGALNTLTLLVAAIALLSALLALHQQRMPEYAHWRALGVTFTEWLKIVAAPLLLMVIVTGLLAVPLGAILSWLLIHKLNVIAFGWTMPMTFAFDAPLRLGAITLVIVLVTLLITALKVRRELPVALKQLASNDA